MNLLQVSVPFRGLDAFGLFMYVITVMYAISFRPLSGIRCFRTELAEEATQRAMEGFRPLSGIRCFRTPGLLGRIQGSHWVSVPFRGLDAFGPPNLLKCGMLP